MTFDELQKNWQSQPADPKLAIDCKLLLREVKRNQRCFEAAIFWRDVREVAVAIILVAVFMYYGIRDSLWPLCLIALLCLWVAVFMVTDRIIQKRKQPCLSGTLFNCIKSSLAQINHQIWLLRNVLWWYLGPLGVGLMIFFSSAGISVMINENPSIGWVLFIVGCIVGTILLYWGIYWLNQRAVHKDLIPRKNELEELLNSLKNANA